MAKKEVKMYLLNNFLEWIIKNQKTIQRTILLKN